MGNKTQKGKINIIEAKNKRKITRGENKGQKTHDRTRK